MNVLIVDDQISVISSLTSNINWEELHIKNVYTALNTLEARTVIADRTIDILLCDIEMPTENGLSLLRWCRKEGYTFECIFLTCHADFLYAQEAIKLGIFDYVLQPARYEDVEKVVLRAVMHIQASREKNAYARLGELAYTQKNNILKNVLHDWMGGKPSDLGWILDFLKRINIHLTPDTNACLFMFQIINRKDEPLDFSEWNNIAEKLLTDIFSHYGCRIFSYCPDHISIKVILYGDHVPKTVQSFDQNRLSMIQAEFDRSLSCNTALYVTPSCTVQDLPLSAKAIIQECSENISLNTGIFHTHAEYLSSTITLCNTEQLELFCLFLMNYQPEKAKKSAFGYLEELNRGNLLNHETLLSFCNDYLQAAYSAAKAIHLPAHTLPSLNEFIHASGCNFLNIQLAQEYLRELTAFFESNAPSSISQSYHLSAIEEYVDSNLDKPLLCTDVAKAVHLSSDYITRLFQTEKGISLKEYITQSKMLEARRLLITTMLPISIVASKVGYDNASHFSKVYKKELGHSPSKERDSYV